MDKKLLLQAKNISHNFDYPLFDDITLEIFENDTIAIMGKSGSGKSTFLNILCSLLNPSNGEVIFNSNNIYKLKKDNLLNIRRDDFGIIFQAHYLFRGFSAVENLEVASLLSDNKINNELLVELNIDFVMKQSVGELSGGQQQRLAIARVLTKKPKIIFADEPTGNLDKKTSQDVMNVLLNYVRKNSAALVIVTHEDDVAKKCNKIYELEDLKLRGIHETFIG